MASSGEQDLDELLRETLQDFASVQPARSSVLTSPGMAARAKPQHENTTSGTLPTPGAKQPMGLGSKLPARGGRQAAGAKSMPRTQHHAEQGIMQQPAADPAHGHQRTDAASRQLPAHVQTLADELMKMVDEAGFGGMDGAGLPNLGGDADAEISLHALAGQLQSAGLDAGAHKQHASTAAPRSSGTLQGQSAALRGLMERTQHTVSQESQFARGEGPNRRAQPGNSQGESGGANSFPGGDGMNNFMVDFVMQSLVSKDVLYTPMKEIHDKYPPWLAANAPFLNPEDLARFTGQFTAIEAVCEQYERDPSNMSRVMELIQKMQTYGDPPADIVDSISSSINSDLAAGSPGDTSGEEGFGDLGLGTGGLGGLAGLPGMGGLAGLAGVGGMGGMGGMGGLGDLGNLQLPPELLKDLPPELQKECIIM